MAYIPLHHKYRPQTFAQLVGQAAIASTLSNALTQKRIAPAYLFTGARGTGKTSSARIFAKSLNCIASPDPTPQPCGTCETCREITQGSALDVIEIDAASNTGVDNIRELIERAQFAPVRCRYKVYVIDEVHMLSNAAFNALLKTLEEPPDRVVFILATTDPQRVLPTIISRCQRFDFRRIPLDAMVQHLSYIATQEQISIATDAVQLVAQISQGGLRDAESLLDQLSLLPGEVTTEKVWDLVGAVPERDLMALVQAIAADDAETMLDHTRRLMDRGREPLIVLQNLASFYRDLLIAKTAPQRNDLVAVTVPTWEQMVGFVQTVETPWLLHGQQHLRSAEPQLKNTTQPRLWLEVTLMGLLPSALGNLSAPQPQAPASRPAPAKPTPQTPPIAPPKASTPPTPTSAPKPPEPTPVEPVAPIAAEPSQPAKPAENTSDGVPANPSSADLETIWQQILDNIDQASTLGIIKANCYLLEIQGEAVRIGVTQKSMLEMMKQRVPQLGKACAKALRTSVKITLKVVPPRSQPETPTPPPIPTQTFSAPEPIAPPSPTIAPPTPRPQPSPTPPIAQAQPVVPPTPQQIVPPIVDEDWADEVVRAAKSLAHAFDGKVVSLDEEDAESADTESIEPSEPSDPIETPAPIETVDDDDSDVSVPF